MTVAVAVDDRVQDYYNLGLERHRLLDGPSLELIRTRLLLGRRLPKPPARVLDVGGGAGVHAAWLAERGYTVDLIDPVPLHIEQAAALPGVTATQGDARALPQPDQTIDVVLLLGPLYHLTEAADRHQALSEAHRVLAPGGLLAAAAISRYAPMFDAYWRGHAAHREFVRIMHADLRTGQHRNPTTNPDWFTTAYLHTPDDLASELQHAGFTGIQVLPVEGPLHWAPHLAEHLADPTRLADLLATLDLLEVDPAIRAATTHLLASGRKPAA